MARPSTVIAGLATAGAAGLAWSVVETRWFVLRHATVPVLERGAEAIRVLHLSDAHLTPAQGRKRSWLASLADLRPDLVVTTGDNIAHRDAVGPLLESYGGLLDVPGVFVFGSNDYFSPTAKNPAKYLTGGTGASLRAAQRRPDLPYEDLRRGFTEAGWLDLNNAHGELEIRGRRLSFVGVDDPHLEYDRLDDEPADPGADLAIGVAHAPYRRVLDRWNAAGYPLLLAGHTHGGQLRIPGYGAVVTNCDLPRAMARGLHRYRPADAPASQPSSWLHVSAGLGTSPYSPVRFCCRPEATLLTLTG